MLDDETFDSLLEALKKDGLYPDLHELGRLRGAYSDTDEWAQHDACATNPTFEESVCAPSEAVALEQSSLTYYFGIALVSPAAA